MIRRMKKGFMTLMVFSLIFTGLAFSSQAHAASQVAQWYNLDVKTGSTVQLGAFIVPQGSEISLRIDQLNRYHNPNMHYVIKNSATNATLASFSLTNNFGYDAGDSYTKTWTNLNAGTYVITVKNNAITGTARIGGGIWTN